MSLQDLKRQATQFPASKRLELVCGSVHQQIYQGKLVAITENLERLEWFGLVISDTRDRLTTWHHADSAKAA